MASYVIRGIGAGGIELYGILGVDDSLGPNLCDQIILAHLEVDGH